MKQNILVLVTSFLKEKSYVFGKHMFLVNFVCLSVDDQHYSKCIFQHTYSII